MLRKLVGHCAEFVQPKDGVLLAEYFRNNKSMGIKNIQCFPQCVSEDKLDGIHKVGRSCVGSVIIKYTFTANSRHSPPDMVKAFAKFTRTEESDPESPTPEAKSSCSELFRVEGKGVPKDIVAANELCRKNKLGVLFVSNCTNTVTKTNSETGLTEHEYTFEFKPRTWHYGWRGGRYRKCKHMIDISVCHVDSNGRHFCKANIKSTAFTVLSNRTLKNRKRKMDEFTQKEKGKENDSSLGTALASPKSSAGTFKKVKVDIAKVSKSKKKASKQGKRSGSARKQRKVKIETFSLPRATPTLVQSPTMKVMQQAGLASHLTNLQHFPGIFVDSLDSSSAIFQEGNLNDANEAAKEETPTVFDFSNIGDFKADVLCQQYDTPEHLHDQTFYLAH